MSELSEKPFEPTPHRLVKARREGNVARSSELAANLSFAAGGLTLVAIVPALGAVACNALAAAASSGSASYTAALIPGLALLSIAGAATAGALANLMQNGGFFVVAVTPKLERLNPFEGVKRILSRETLAHSMRASFAFASATGVMVPFIAFSAVAFLRAAGVNEIAAQAWLAARQVALAACVVGCCFALAEYGAARNAWLRKLRMSFEERKRESKEEEGDGTARGRRRSLHRALLRGGMQRLKDASFVVANPQHVAVALEYRPPSVPVPRVLVRAADATAARVRALAERHRIPIVENVELARALYRDGRAGEPIPHAHYIAVAEVVTALLRSDGIPH